MTKIDENENCMRNSSGLSGPTWDAQFPPLDVILIFIGGIQGRLSPRQGIKGPYT